VGTMRGRWALAAVTVVAAASPVFGALSATAAVTSDPAPFPFAAQIAQVVSGSRVSIAVAVYDDDDGAFYVYRPQAGFITASIVKVQILGTLLYEAEEHHRWLTSWEYQEAVPMIEDSDNDAATELWDHVGQAPGVSAFDRLVPMPNTDVGPGGYWGLTDTTAPDQVALLARVAFPNGLLASRYRDLALDLMSHVTASQRWGVSAGPPAGVSVALKNGWLPRSDGWHVNSIGIVNGSGMDYLVAVLTSGDTSMSDAVSRIQDVARLIWTHLARPAPALLLPTSSVAELVWREQSGALILQVYRDGREVSWSSAGLIDIGTPAAVQLPGRLLVAARDPDGDLRVRQFVDGKWSNGAPIGGPDGASIGATSQPAMVRTSTGTVDAFVRGASGAIYASTLPPGAGSWSAWSSLGGYAVSAPAADVRPNGTIDVFTIGSKLGVDWRVHTASGWGSWQSLGGVADGNPAAAADSHTGTVYVLYHSADGTLHGRSLAPGTTTWRAFRMTGSFVSSPAVAASGGTVDVAAVTAAGQVYIADTTGAAWSAWRPI
jgi:hypothetical protein